MEPEKIRVLLATPPDRFEKLAKKLELPLPVARDIRIQAMNLILGKCVLCGKYTLAGMCSHCERNAPQRRMIPWSSIKLLKMMDPSDQLLRQLCDKCGKPFMLSASYLLKKLLLKHPEDTKRTCGACQEKAQKAERQLQLQKLEAEWRAAIVERRKQEEATRRRQAAEKRATERAPKLVYQPFAGNRDLTRLKRELPKAPFSTLPPERAKRG